jgi:hypothetical protein
MVHRLFQEAGAGVHLNKFRAFLQRLQEGMLRLEFAHYDTTGAERTHASAHQPAAVHALQVRSLLLPGVQDALNSVL